MHQLSARGGAIRVVRDSQAAVRLHVSSVAQVASALQAAMPASKTVHTDYHWHEKSRGSGLLLALLRYISNVRGS